MKHITSYKNKKSPKIRHFLPINITVASRTKIKSRKPLQIKGFWDFAHYSNSSHRRLISVISIAFSLLFIVVFAILAGIILTGIKIVLKMYSYINPIIYSEIQKLSLIIAFAPEFFYQILKFCYRHSTIHFAPIFLLKEHHFMH